MSESDRYHSWLRPDVAMGMRNLIGSELDPETYREHPPFKYFLGAMQHVPDSTSLVDVGCGVGHYSELMHRCHPGISYTGLDFSESMIEQARQLWPGRAFVVADMTEFDYAPYGIVLASSLIEVMDDWMRGVRAMCRTARNAIVLSRVRLHSGGTIRNETIGYPGQPTYTHVHNESELLGLFKQEGFGVIWQVRWTEHPQATYVLERESG